MHDQETRLEQNLSRLLRASLGPDARPAPVRREELRRQLGAQLRVQPRPVEFPRLVLAGFGGVTVLAAAVRLAARFSGAWVRDLTAFTPMAVWLGVNYLVLPVACVVIVVFRRKHAH